MIKRLLQVLFFAFFASNSAASNQPFDKWVNVQVSNSSTHDGEFEIEWVSGFSNEKILEKSIVVSGGEYLFEVPERSRNIRLRGYVIDGGRLSERVKVFETNLTLNSSLNLFGERHYYSADILGRKPNVNWRRVEPKMGVDGLDPYSIDPQRCTKVKSAFDKGYLFSSESGFRLMLVNLCRFDVEFLFENDKKYPVKAESTLSIYRPEYKYFTVVRKGAT